jgi:hypothetical protein
VIVANPAMIKAYKDGIPGNGKHFPNGKQRAASYSVEANLLNV